MAEVHEHELEDVLPPIGGNGSSTESVESGLQWLRDKQGRDYIPRQDGRSGIIVRQGDETIEQAISRDSRPKAGDKRPRRKSKPRMPEAPRKVDLKELEQELSMALKAPAAVARTFGDEWLTDHFDLSAPYLARNLVLAAEHNPWLRKKLEEAATGQDAMMKIIGLVGVSGALIGYAVPPIIYVLNLPVPEKARELWGMPPRRETPPPYAAGPPPAPESPIPA